MKEKLSSEIYFIGCAAICLIFYNLIPFIATFIEYESYNILEFLSLVLINPIIIVICSYIYGKKFGLSWFLSVILVFCFVPTTIIFFDVSYLFYLFIYIVFSVSSQILGISFRKISLLKD